VTPPERHLASAPAENIAFNAWSCLIGCRDLVCGSPHEVGQLVPKSAIVALSLVVSATEILLPACPAENCHSSAKSVTWVIRLLITRYSHFTECAT